MSCFEIIIKDVDENQVKSESCHEIWFRLDPTEKVRLG